MHIAAATAPGSPDVPNEDHFVITPGLVAVIDGATVRTETGCTHGAAWYAQTLGAALAYHVTWEIPLQFVLEQAIIDVAVRHEKTCDLSHAGTPSAGVGIVHLLPDRVCWLVLGDVTVVLDTTTGVQVVSDQRISQSAAAERAEVDRHPIGSPEKAEALIRMKHVELAARGRDYWVAAADPLVATHALTGEVPFDELYRFAVLTDGAARQVDLFQISGWPGVLDGLRSAGPEWHIQQLVRGVERHDPLGVRFPRNKCSDDATVVYTEMLTPRHDEGGVSEDAITAARDELRARVTNPALLGDGMLLRQR